MMSDPIRVLIADDHTLVRQGTRRLLEQQPDIDVIGEAADGEEALRLVASMDPDVALVDLAMPRLDGLETCRRISADHPGVEVIVLTVHDEPEHAKALLEAGASGYLLKDVDTEELAAAIRSVHRGKAVLDPKLVRALVESMGAAEETAAPKPSPREADVLRLTALGLSNREIADSLGISAWTVQSHLANVFEKLGASSRTQAVVKGLHAGWIDLNELS